MRSTALALLALAGCGDEAAVAALAQVSQQVQFEAVDSLGPHHFLGSVHHRRMRSDGTVGRTDEAVEIRWQDWDSFEFRRSVDGELATAVIARSGVPWMIQANGTWRREEDAEPFRLELRQSWNAWDQALEPYLDRIVYDDRGTEVVEGRQARRYGLSLAPPVARPDAASRGGKAAKRRKAGRDKSAEPSGDRLLSIAGEVWVDESTAVRLLADVQAERIHRGRSHAVELKVVRSDIGRDQQIQAPDGDAKKGRKKRKSRPAGTSLPPTPQTEEQNP